MRIPLSVILIAPILAEIAVFIVVGKTIGVLPTLGLVLAGMAIGGILLRRQGVATLTKVQADLKAGGTSARPLADGVVLAVAALLIAIPGFLTDLVGIALFIPPFREILWRAFRRRFAVRTAEWSETSQRRGVVDLDPSEYAAARRGDGRAESPWRLPGEPGT